MRVFTLRVHLAPLTAGRWPPLQVEVEKRGVTSCGSKLKVNGAGMPRRGGGGGAFGDLELTFEVDFPASLRGGEKQREAIRSALAM